MYNIINVFITESERIFNIIMARFWKIFINIINRLKSKYFISNINIYFILNFE